MSGLQVRDLSVHFGGVYALKGVALNVPSGVCVGLTGPNGSGKSTLVNAVTGVVDARGDVRVDDRPLPLSRPGRAARLGLRRTYQTPRVHDELTGLENACAGHHVMTGRMVTGALLSRFRSARAERDRRRDAMAALGRVGGDSAAPVRGSAMPYGQRRLVELARVLVGEPRVLLLDEPSAGLNDVETEALCRLIRELTDTGVAVLLIEHRIGLLNEVCDQLVVLEEGVTIHQGAPRDVWRHDRVRAAYIGDLSDAGA
ncbi:ABC-type branched-subunit amino acid transport system ATPase component [Streptosporangium album]|uniref:ABC-type branched-subunit amino acid transport system ATPase component n=1 Tax=Streptosporangium album TaxID=47479 RepID=A0A7W7S7C4_9ACTN|nr:ATP-binding cassette domain-containing protein [Streptosporangium album]MBB4944186.1 ABC-type branched-subunit amino acid transport system ATPase component [Streptosporangium album]